MFQQVFTSKPDIEKSSAPANYITSFKKKIFKTKETKDEKIEKKKTLTIRNLNMINQRLNTGKQDSIKHRVFLKRQFPRSESESAEKIQNHNKDKVENFILIVNKYQ